MYMFFVLLKEHFFSVIYYDYMPMWRFFASGVTTRLKSRQGVGFWVWGVGKIEAMQSAKWGFPVRPLHRNQQPPAKGMFLFRHYPKPHTQ
ncbi:hypothetical protein BJP34_29230 [Moorena producens PAL-8-15-08-1]|uniref:Uncharacterized protein n=1 Tax=Moorena producens PAL-8-15-08-1 TaxID=1458985 RepID=A0A1D8TZA7_9CYAN|nr:hypothetical protein BJP34_29230 [Moorena producens PAL-8-15-08-1]